MKGKDRQSKGAPQAVRAGRAATRAASHRIRIIGGAWKRTPLAVPDLPGLRPTPDRVRETLFNWLGFLRPDFSSLRALDLFAGTGALGFELASRGASRVVLVEREAALLRHYRALTEKLGAGDRIEIISGEALSVARHLEAGSFDVVFVDPPFGSDQLSTALTQVGRLIATGGLVYVEWGEPVPDAFAAAHGFSVIRAGRAGRVAFHLLARADDE